MGTTPSYHFGPPPVRQTTPNLTLPNGGNDATMQSILKRGAPMGSSGGAGAAAWMSTPPAAVNLMQPHNTRPTSILLGQPGPAYGQPAAAPWQNMPPMPARSPMAAVPSGMNHSYDGGMGFGSGLAGRAPVQKGRSNYDLDRIAQQQWRQNRNPQMLQSQQWFNRSYPQPRNDGTVNGAPAAMPPPMPAAPSGHFVPGVSAGSQVWVRDNPPPADAPASGEPAPEQMPQPHGMTPPGGAAGQGAAPAPFSFPMPMLPWDGKGPLPPSTLGGGSGVPPPPPVQRYDVPGPDGKPLAWQGFGPDGKPLTAMHGTYPQPDAAKPKEVPKIYDEGGIETVDPKTGAKSKSPTRHYYFEPHPNTGVPVKRYVQDEASDGSGDVGYNPFAKPAPKQPAPAPKPRDEVQTGQVPSANYPNDLTPEQSLAAAREHYAKTGDDSKIREHFQSFPSQASQLLKQEQDLWQKIGVNSQADEETLSKRALDHRTRDRALSHSFLSTPATQGALAQFYDWQFPDQAKNLGAPARLNTQASEELMAKANELNRRYQQEAAREKKQREQQRYASK